MRTATVTGKSRNTVANSVKGFGKSRKTATSSIAGGSGPGAITSASNATGKTVESGKVSTMHSLINFL